MRRIPLSRRSHITGFQPLPTGTAEHESALERDFVARTSLLDPAASIPAAVRMQAAMLRGKHGGITELDGLGRFTWKEIVALADVLIGMVWTDLTLAEQEEVFLSYTSDPATKPSPEDAVFDCRHASLQFLTWLTEGWPTSPGAQVGQSMLIRRLTVDRNRLCRHLRPPPADPWTAGPNNFEPSIRERLRILAGAP